MKQLKESRFVENKLVFVLPLALLISTAGSSAQATTCQTAQERNLQARNGKILPPATVLVPPLRRIENVPRLIAKPVTVVIGEKAPPLINRSTTNGSVLNRPPTSFVATAYSLRGRTASGRYTTRGIIAADRKLLPMGSRVLLKAGNYSGEYAVADTGSAIRGRIIDIWMPSTREARRFGRRKIKLTVLHYGAKRSRIKKRR